MTKVLLLLCLLLTAQTQASKNYGNYTVAKLINVYDGDTIRVDLANCKEAIICKNISIRIFGIDTPEIRGKCQSEKRLAKIARNKLRTILNAADNIEIRTISRGKYFRIVGKVFANGVEAGNSLVDENLAFRYFGGKKQSWCAK